MLCTPVMYLLRCTLTLDCTYCKYIVFPPTNTKIFINAVLKVHFAHFILTVAATEWKGVSVSEWDRRSASMKHAIKCQRAG